MEIFGLELQMFWLVFPLIGCIAGLLAGMLGLGGGIVLVPGLFFFLQSQGIAAGYEMQFALGTSLACIVPTSLSATLAHISHKNIIWTIYKVLVPGFLIGGIIGALLADFLNTKILELIFGGICFLIATRLLIGFVPKSNQVKMFNAFFSALHGTIMGAIAALSGIGGGALVNPYMLWAGYNTRHAIGTAAAAVFAISLFGSLTYGFNTPSLYLTIPHLGYVIWPAVIAVVIFSIGTAPIGAYLAQKLPTRYLKKFLAFILLIVSLKFLF